ncbi:MULTISPECIES: sulfur oxidation c-type cytochrome SoxA [unclassified Rhizobacter]|uniref:sulfur oxidation c-type cytochrome SoxA n=1 Tax=unclassified Rhizobacter TaxID=2640088 RepID=UPI0006F74051|nr:MULTISPECIES: sulfur oxidation c-type cytochrome SoxA [unclassified Rhizobacter]KQU67097.1 sulfur oxidation c-type cytochrome SoxA [Rhizobacter sp. Root29]KQV98192.1 sulfur oxidation c-type cytochrome SoxA [Rhizobacter sp. Root1238]KRB02090.1 sulfur oxidation c-type cytochrome SoxA [Rhizobacter sp. Root16D2]
MRHLLWLMLGVALHAVAQPARRSGFDDMSPSTQAMQRDDAQNPAMLWVQDGAALWARAPSPSVPACAGCHGEARASMRGVAARYPAYDEALAQPIDLATRINRCRETHQGASRWAPDSQELLSLESHLALQSRGMPVEPPADARLLPWRERGEAVYRARIGQLNLSCAQCHDERAGLRLGGGLIPQGHANGYPLYRLEWQGVGSLLRRIRNCMTGVRAQPLPAESPEFAALATYLAWRDRGMTMESPAVRP